MGEFEGPGLSTNPQYFQLLLLVDTTQVVHGDFFCYAIKYIHRDNMPLFIYSVPVFICSLIYEVQHTKNALLVIMGNY